MNTQSIFGNIKINSCGVSDCDASWSWDTGKQGFQDFDLWFVLRGKGRIITERGIAEVNRGSCMLLFPETRYIGEQDELLLIMNVHFQIEKGEDTLSENDKEPFLHKKIYDISYMRETLSRVIRLYNSGKYQSAQTFFSAALSEYFEGNSDDTSQKCGTDKPRLVQKICDTVNLSPGEKHSLAAFAAEYGYSADYLGRIFSRSVGISFSDYVSNARINKAKFLLSSTELSVEGIADTLGYYDTCYFVRQFRRITGVSPGKYRRS